MKAFLMAYDLWDTVKKENIFPIIAATTAKKVWDLLQGTERVRTMKLQMLRREFEMLKMTEEHSIKEYSSKLIEVVNQMKLHGEKISNERIIEKILITYEQRTSKRTEESLEDTFQVRHKANTFLVRNQPLRNQAAGKDYKRKGVEATTKQVDRRRKYAPCKICNRTNHLEKDCWHKRQEAMQSRMSIDWYIESGCTNHLTFDANLFITLDTSVKIKVKMGNAQYVNAEGKGTIAVHKGKATKLISNVLLIHNLDQNLLSVAQMMDKGY
ncbi:uncharacterized protein LOC111400471 [Olea europaea var. sylvestris]|uniref:uncharacterized protein LOC111400471 n=1 Tax=Olea europaea var. sylvestris TaxID=158386 RepID=UPI000C1CD059|nr:uncharacterized protein LOC111400471 [Olea europaea var. sylvestris]